ncbi:uncharacterized protein LOC124816772 isoform X1 [Hydra vulgaris]|uniref:uncharacterized protein LOC124816772 isoform X1 n=1 Tax=Hydra vulgaris TaxID=6087 RepID=UPI0032EA6C58
MHTYGGGIHITILSRTPSLSMAAAATTLATITTTTTTTTASSSSSATSAAAADLSYEALINQGPYPTRPIGYGSQIMGQISPLFVGGEGEEMGGGVTYNYNYN